MKEEYVMIRKDTWNKVINKLATLADEVKVLKNKFAGKQLYTTQDLCSILKVTSSSIRRYREEGILGYTNEGNKYWYSVDDIRNFLKHNKIEYNL